MLKLCSVGVVVFLLTSILFVVTNSSHCSVQCSLCSAICSKVMINTEVLASEG